MVFFLPRPQAPAKDERIQSGMAEMWMWLSRLIYMYPDLHHRYWIAVTVVLLIHISLIIFDIQEFLLSLCALKNQDLEMAIEKGFLFIDVFFYHFSYFNFHIRRKSLDRLLAIIGSKFYSYNYIWTEEDQKMFFEERQKFKEFKKKLVKFIFTCATAHSLILPLIKVMWSGRFSTASDGYPINKNFAMGFAYYLPIDDRRLSGFLLGYVIEAAFVYFMCALIICTDVFLLDFVDQLRRQMRILTRAVQLIPERALQMYQGNDKEKFIESDEYQECLYKALTENIKHHVILQRYKSDLQKLVVYWLLLLFVGSGITICAGGYLVLKMKATGLVIFLNAIIYLSVSLVVIYLYCSSSEELDNMSLAYNEALYNTYWYEYNRKFKNAVYLSLMFNQNIEYRLKIFNVTNYSLMTFGDILKTSFSYINLLSAVGN
nr:olfactory receptor 71 [Tropidothorax elegans]